MKVKELIEELSKQDPELCVLVRGYESGYNHTNFIEKSFVIPNPMKKINYWWEGEFEVAKEGEPVIIIKT